MWRIGIGLTPAIAVLIALFLWVPLGGTFRPTKGAGDAVGVAQRPLPTDTPLPTRTPSPTPTATPMPTVAPSPTATPTATGVMPVALRIPTIGISAKVIPLGLNPDRSMQSPDGPDPVAWYTFSARPGAPGNALFAGHVDWHTGVTGVFWRLRELRPGDRIYVGGEDGKEYVYAVVSSDLYPVATAPVEEIIGPKPGEVITLISGEGVFNSATHDYDHRRVVRGERVTIPSPTPAALP